ncbi:maleylpyruvate isomerase N-terminal domain-containing protein [Streptomyces graminilatus]|uniref:maleylpyruvate isomerase N-terminal domain-containing protein n=1 Tax=Streptomyces graminilatus TaxID=1464070 RepID=UPI0006E45B36|nr:maleylpyruvate isomerase N-terminal domain-containing protein [Streptomyces graminilatus]
MRETYETSKAYEGYEGYEGYEISHERICAGIEREAALCAEALLHADPARPVGTCPGWTVSHLTAHLFQAYTWAAGLVETRAAEFVPPHVFVAGADDDRWGKHTGTWAEYVDELIGVSIEEAASLGGAEARARWVRGAADSLVATLRRAGPDTDVWSSVGAGGTRFWASWGAMETAVHRADLDLLLGRAPDTVGLSPELSLDSVRFWLRAVTAPGAEAFFGPGFGALAGDGESLRFRATDATDEAYADWLVVRTPTGPVLAAPDDGGRAGVTITGRAGDLLLLLKRRVAPREAAVDITGDARLLEHWWTHVIV